MGTYFSSPIFNAIKANNTTELRRLLEAMPRPSGVTQERSSIKNTAGWMHDTPLLLAVNKGFYGIVRVLINHDVDVNKRSGGMTALYTAVYHGHKDIVKLLLQNGAYINDTCCDNMTPLWIALHQHDSFGIHPKDGPSHIDDHLLGKSQREYIFLDIAKLLVESGANVNENAFTGRIAPYSSLGKLIFPNLLKPDLTANPWSNDRPVFGFDLASFGVMHSTVLREKLDSLKRLMTENGAVLTSYEYSLFANS